MKVRVGTKYVFQPVGYDFWDPKVNVAPGTIVRVVNLCGAPPANTMGHAYIESVSGEFLGLVLTASLERYTKRAAVLAGDRR